MITLVKGGKRREPGLFPGPPGKRPTYPLICRVSAEAALRRHPPRPLIVLGYGVHLSDKVGSFTRPPLVAPRGCSDFIPGRFSQSVVLQELTSSFSA